MGAIGASFGGYTVYWLMGNAADKFACMIAHCGVFNLESMYGATEELFFVNWDLGGPYWKDQATQALYDKFSPHKFIGNWDTPLLVIHGAQDEYGSASQPARLTENAGRGAELHLLDDCGHVPHREQPEEVMTRLVRFLAACV